MRRWRAPVVLALSAGLLVLSLVHSTGAPARPSPAPLLHRVALRLRPRPHQTSADPGGTAASFHLRPLSR